MSLANSKRKYLRIIPPNGKLIAFKEIAFTFSFACCVKLSHEKRSSSLLRFCLS
ncbi:MAG: hypothetical protein ACTS4W_00080 [Candidatus Hodgkinia cicadicola]